MSEATRADLRRARRARGWFGQGRTRALLSLGLISALTAVGTTAYWVDSGQARIGSISSGTMDMQLRAAPSTTWDAVGLGTGFAATSIAVSDFYPGESHAFDLDVRNVGNATFDYTATVQRGDTPGWTYGSASNPEGPIRIQFFRGRATVDTSFPIQENCGAGATALGSVVTPPLQGSRDVMSARRIAAGTEQLDLCMVVSMVRDATNEDQGKVGTLLITFNAVQVSQ